MTAQKSIKKTPSFLNVTEIKEIEKIEENKTFLITPEEIVEKHLKRRPI